MSKSRVSLECSEADGNDRVTEITAAIERDDEPDTELACQVLVMTPAEMAALYQRMGTYYAHGTWSMGSVQR